MDDRLILIYLGIEDNYVLQNDGPYYTPTDADFIVYAGGPTVTTGTAGPTGNNIVNSLTFEDGGALIVSNTLTVTSGAFFVDHGTALLSGDEGHTGGFCQVRPGAIRD